MCIGASGPSFVRVIHRAEQGLEPGQDFASNLQIQVTDSIQFNSVVFISKILLFFLENFIVKFKLH